MQWKRSVKIFAFS